MKSKERLCMKDKRFIEESFPLKEVSTESAREKNIRRGHISTLHIWWARRPLASSRATSYAALIPAPKSVEEMMDEWGIDPVPDESLDWNCLKQRDVLRYGMNTWGDLFNARQKLALITFVEKVRLAHKKMIEEGYDGEYAKAVVGYLGLFISRFSSYHCVLVLWQPGYEKVQRAFSRQALGMIWDYTQVNPLSLNVGGWESLIKDTNETISHL